MICTSIPTIYRLGSNTAREFKSSQSSRASLPVTQWQEIQRNGAASPYFPPCLHQIHLEDIIMVCMKVIKIHPVRSFSSLLICSIPGLTEPAPIVCRCQDRNRRELVLKNCCMDMMPNLPSPHFSSNHVKVLQFDPIHVLRRCL